MTTHRVPRPSVATAVDSINDAASKDPPLRIDYNAEDAAFARLLPVQASYVRNADARVTTLFDVDGKDRQVATGDIRAVRTTNHLRGALQGLGIGVLAGAAMGAVVGASDNDSLFSGSTGAMIGGVVYGALGGLVGTFIGAAAGSQTVFVFD